MNAAIGILGAAALIMNHLDKRTSGRTVSSENIRTLAREIEHQEKDLKELDARVDAIRSWQDKHEGKDHVDPEDFARVDERVEQLERTSLKTMFRNK